MTTAADFRLCYLTAPNEKVAEEVARALLTDRLVACVNIVPKIRSFYWWNGAISTDEECVLFAKTRAALVPEVLARIKTMHPYEIPAFVSLAVDDGNPEFLKWIASETHGRPTE